MVLIVDDHAPLARSLVSLLGTSGFEAHAVHSGAEALAFVRSHPAVTLVLLDMSMPDMSGIEVLQALRVSSSEHSNSPSIVMFSANDDQAIHDELIRLGAAGFVNKSNPAGLLRIVAAHVRPITPPRA